MLKTHLMTKFPLCPASKGISFENLYGKCCNWEYFRKRWISNHSNQDAHLCYQKRWIKKHVGLYILLCTNICRDYNKYYINVSNTPRRDGYNQAFNFHYNKYSCDMIEPTQTDADFPLKQLTLTWLVKAIPPTVTSKMNYHP